MVDVNGNSITAPCCRATSNNYFYSLSYEGRNGKYEDYSLFDFLSELMITRNCDFTSCCCYKHVSPIYNKLIKNADISVIADYFIYILHCVKYSVNSVFQAKIFLPSFYLQTIVWYVSSLI